jgi:hypothetical protein
MNYSPYLSPGIPTDPKYWELDMKDAYTERSFELGAMSRDELFDVITELDGISDEQFDTLINMPASVLSSFILEQEFAE